MRRGLCIADRLTCHTRTAHLLYTCHTRAAGPTIVLQQSYDPHLRAAVPENPKAAVVSLPSAGGAVLLAGTLGHGVLEGRPDTVRATFIANWWT